MGKGEGKGRGRGRGKWRGKGRGPKTKVSKVRPLALSADTGVRYRGGGGDKNISKQSPAIGVICRPMSLGS